MPKANCENRFRTCMKAKCDAVADPTEHLDCFSAARILYITANVRIFSINLSIIDAVCYKLIILFIVTVTIVVGGADSLLHFTDDGVSSFSRCTEKSV